MFERYISGRIERREVEKIDRDRAERKRTNYREKEREREREKCFSRIDEEPTLIVT